MSDQIAPDAPAKLYKLRNAGGVESWFNEREKNRLLADVESQWTLVETANEDEVNQPASTEPATEDAPATAPTAPKDEAPANTENKPKKAK